MDISEDLLQNDDDVSCGTEVTRITGTSFITQYRISDLPEFLGHSVDEAVTEFNSKHSVYDPSHLQNYMDSSKHDPIKWEDLTHDHIIQNNWDSFANYMGKYARNKTKVKFSDGNS